METRRDERISQLIQALKRSDKLHLKEAASLLGVSEMTIRRDLNGHSGPVVLLGGYIVLEPRSATHYLLSDQKNPAGRGKTPCRSPCGRAAGGPSDGLLRLRDHHAVDY
ncbi:Deoxyribose operon repressor [Klebsiella pneumoniae]|uniref:Deoxyribose operon repressor n=1 Tax=Klebsiella pneumoniae TaxID=573 RepID=A0A378BFG3_KLEPN|nr:Deoxyribose operon repressor [Klebsiella pneumoniae]